ncbi:hypothetical protein [Streptomyces albus]|uniref:hypothetical protein n=1 Tax=Streptomyces sp. HPH0547 TaxID=1203592 RepID=UPI00039C0C2F|nr:hypothetical protein [Streptomyces sp. HPH0547]
MIRTEMCFVAVCDVCGGTETTAGGTPHGDTVQSVIDIVTEKWGDPRSGWTLTSGGQLVCDVVDDRAHREAHEAAGKTISDCAMVVKWPRQEVAA